MYPTHKIVSNDPNTSWTFCYRRLTDGIPFEWDCHSQYELTLILNSQGYRYIGDHIAEYDDNDLVLVGPGVAHSWRSVSSVDPERPHQVYVIKFTEAWLEAWISNFSEVSFLGDAFRRGFQGLKFSSGVASEVAAIVAGMAGLEPPLRLIRLLGVLLALGMDEGTVHLGRKMLNSGAVVGDFKVSKALRFMHLNYSRSIKVSEMADVVCLSVSGFQRMFKRHTNCCPLTYLMKLRIGAACDLLVGGEYSIARVANEVGYDNVSLFNRQFLKEKHETPSQFRRKHKFLSGMYRSDLSRVMA